MDIPKEALELLQEEQEILENTLSSLAQQQREVLYRLQGESTRARRLTADIVQARQVEEKQMLASDEAVSHSLSKYQRDEVEKIDKLLKSPYFARLVVEEETPSGMPKRLEYLLGTASNLDCRIVDWRNAPIAKLYYEYSEGDEYDEDIQEKERCGQVVLRNKIEIVNGELKRVRCRYGDFVLQDQTWLPIQMATTSTRRYGQLPDVLSLITPEQFRMITEEANTAILIQGIAGSGKTTVALYRLSWLIHQKDHDCPAENSLVVVRSPSLKRYIELSLGTLNLEKIQLLTLREWFEKVLAKVLKRELPQDKQKRPYVPGMKRLKRSHAILRALEERANPGQSLEEQLLKTLSDPIAILKHDESKLIDSEQIKNAYQATKNNFKQGYIDKDDYPLLLRLHQITKGPLPRPRDLPGHFSHILVDEIQDWSSPELAVLISSVKKPSSLTLVGDTSQQSSAESSFPGWDKLRDHWSLGDNVSRYVELSVSHRSSLPIMKLADHVLGLGRTLEGRPGKKPRWTHCFNEEQALTRAIKWLERTLDKDPFSITAIVTRHREEKRYLQSLLQPTFGMAVREWSPDDFTFEEGVVICTANDIKGLEFPNILIWNPSPSHYKKDRLSRNLLYIAITRAEERLAILSWGKTTRLLPSIDSKLVHGLDLTEDE